MSAARPHVNIMEPQVKNVYWGFSPSSPRTMSPYGETARYTATARMPRPMTR